MSAALIPAAMSTAGMGIGLASGNSFGPKNISTTPQETAEASASAGQVGQDVFGSGNFGGTMDTLRSGLNQGGFNTEGALEALMNPTPYDQSGFYEAHKGIQDERVRNTGDAANAAAGGFGNRFGSAANQMMSRSIRDVEGEFDRNLQGINLADMSRMDQSRAAGVQGANQQGGLLGNFIQMLLQFVQPQNVYDPGMGRAMAESLMGGGSDMMQMQGMQAAFPNMFGGQGGGAPATTGAPSWNGIGMPEGWV